MVVLYELAERVWALLQQGWNWLRRKLWWLRDRLLSLLDPMALPVAAKPKAATAPPASPNTSEVGAAVANPAPAQPVPAKAPAAAPESATATDDETALARMLASEGTTRDTKIVTGWIAVQVQRRERKPTLYQMLTRGQGYGPQDRTAKGKEPSSNPCRK